MPAFNADILKVDVSAVAGQAFRWWIGELHPILDHPYLQKLAKQTDLPVIVLRQDGSLEMQENNARESAGLLGKFQNWVERVLPGSSAVLPATLRLEASHYLACQLELPAVSTRALAALLKFEVERWTPLSLAESCYGYRVLGRDRLTNLIKIELFVAKRKTIAAAIEAAEDMDRRIIGISVATVEGDSVELRGFGGVAPPVNLNAERRRALLLAAAAAVSLAAIAWGYAERQERVADALSDQAIFLQPQATAVTVMSHRGGALLAELNLLKQRKKSEALTPVVEELARVLPDDCWLTTLSIENGSVSLSGFSNSPFRLPALLNASPYFSNAHFLGPVQHQSSDPADRFDLAADIKSGKAK